MRPFTALILAATFFLPEAFCQSNTAEITSLSGTVEVNLQGSDGYAAAEEGMTLETGDTLRTASDASCELSFNQTNSNIVRVSENTTLEILFSGDEKLELTDGEVFSSISELPAGSAFEIRTPTAVSGARGTDWVTKVSGEETEVEAIESTPYVRHFESTGIQSRRETPIAPGQMTSIKRFQQPQPARPVEFNRLQKWQGTKQTMRQNGQQALINKPNRPQFNRNEFKEKIKQQRQMPQQSKQGLLPQQPGKQQLQPQQQQQQQNKQPLNIHKPAGKPPRGGKGKQ